MRIFAAEKNGRFACRMGACPDSCCRQGWQIAIDGAHEKMYRELGGELGDRVRSAMTEQDGAVTFREKNGVCVLLQDDGLCPLAAKLGMDGLCHICRTHPEFIEEYGANREVFLSFSCPEAAELSLCGTEKLRFSVTETDEPVAALNDIDPEQYFALLRARKFSIALMQARKIPICDRFALLLLYAKKLQPLLDEKRYGAASALARRFMDAQYRENLLARVRRLRQIGTSYLPEVGLFRSLEHLTEDFPKALSTAVFTARESFDFDRNFATHMEHMTVLLLTHYLPKAVNDGDAAGKLRFAVLGTLFVRRLCVCTREESAKAFCRCAGLFAKEIEHSEENMAAVFAALSDPAWGGHLLRQLDV